MSCTPLLFKDNILTEQYFGEQKHTSIVTEKDHFGEGMHRKAFRTMVRTDIMPLFGPGHACVLKVHSSIGYGTQNEDEVIEKNYNLAVEVRAGTCRILDLLLQTDQLAECSAESSKDFCFPLCYKTKCKVRKLNMGINENVVLLHLRNHIYSSQN